MPNFQGKIYRERGGDVLTVASGGSIDIESGGAIKAAGAQASNIADAVVAHSITDTANELDASNETELEGFYDALGVKINSILTVLEDAGLMAGP